MSSIFNFDIQLHATRAAVDTASVLQERRDIDYSNDIALLEPDKQPLTVLLRRLNKVTTPSSVYHWFEDELAPKWGKVTAEAAAGDTAITVNNASLFTPRDIIKNARTGEVMQVTAVNDASNQLTVRRGYGTTPAAAISEGDDVVILGNSNEENAKSPQVNLRQPVMRTNFTQIFRKPVSISRTASKERMRGQNERRRLQRKAGIEHAIDIERAFWFGEPKLDTSGEHPQRMTGGVLSFATENHVDFGAQKDVTEGSFEEALEDAFRYGSSEKVLFASARWITLINQWAAGKLRLRPRAETYGLAVFHYVSAHGELNIVKHHLFEGPYAGLAVVLDLENLEYRPFQDDDTKLRENIGDSDRDGFLDEWLTEAGLQLKLPKTHAVLTMTPS